MSEVLGERPHSLEAEKSVISCILQNNALADEVFAVLSEDMFYDPLYRALFRSIEELKNEYFSIDKVTLKEKVVPKSVIKDEVRKGVIKQNFEPSRVDDDFFNDLVISVPITENVLDYCNIIKDKYILRNTISLCEKVIVDCKNGDKNVNDILNDTQGEIYKFSKTKNQGEYVRVDNVVPEVLKRIEAASKTKDGITGVSSGYANMDNITSGFQNTDMIVLAARPAMGKTSFSLNLAYNISKKAGKNAMYFSLEMGVEQLAMRLIAMETGISSTNLRNGRLNEKQWRDLINGTKNIYGTKIYVDDNSYLTIAEFRNKCMKLDADLRMKGEKLDIVMVDYLQLMHAGTNFKNSGKQGFSNRQEEVAEISRNIKALAKELKVPIIALSQLARLEKENKRPQLSDIRESGAIEQDADIVMLIHSNRNDPDAEDKNKTEIIFAKHRNGQTGTIVFKFDLNTTRFLEYDFSGIEQG